jgi:hypothetical protein
MFTPMVILRYDSFEDQGAQNLCQAIGELNKKSQDYSKPQYSGNSIIWSPESLHKDFMDGFIDQQLVYEENLYEIAKLATNI